MAISSDMDSDSGGSTLQYLSDEVRCNFQTIWEEAAAAAAAGNQYNKWMLQGEEELESFLEQHRQAMSASRERESQIRWKKAFCVFFSENSSVFVGLPLSFCSFHSFPLDWYFEHIILVDSCVNHIINIDCYHSKFETWFSGRVLQERLGRARGKIPKTDLWSRLWFVISSYMRPSLISSLTNIYFTTLTKNNCKAFTNGRHVDSENLLEIWIHRRNWQNGIKLKTQSYKKGTCHENTWNRQIKCFSYIWW